MNDLSYEQPYEKNPDDLIRAENAVIRLKLEMEHNMIMSEGVADLDPILEHQFLSNVLEFENNFRKSKRIRLYDFLEKPVFHKTETLTRREVETELDHLHRVMKQKGIVLDCLNVYPCEVIHKFITEELFEEETNDFMMPGMIFHFIYEEYHPGDEETAI